MRAAYINSSVVEETLVNKPTEGKNLLEPFTSFAKEAGAEISLLEITDSESRAEVHRDKIDFFYCLDGEVEFVTSGHLVEPFLRENDDGSKNDLEIRAPRIEDGEVHTLKKGDMIWIPNGLPHSNRAESSGRLLVIKIPAEDIYPLEEVSGWDN